jgi:hypothetical protein
LQVGGREPHVSLLDAMQSNSVPALAHLLSTQLRASVVFGEGEAVQRWKSTRIVTLRDSG